jgi:acetyl-CoA acetyltransferase
MEAYDALAQWWIASGRGTREDLAAYAALMALHAPGGGDAAVTDHHASLDAATSRVLAARPVAPVTTLRECALLGDGAGALILARRPRHSIGSDTVGGAVAVRGLGEASARMGAFAFATTTDGSRFSDDEIVAPLGHALRRALKDAGLDDSTSTSTIGRDRAIAGLFDYASVYDCFPVAFMIALEAFGIVERGQAGPWVREAFARATSGQHLPINLHGGLLAAKGFGAPGDVPAMFGIIEAVLRTRDRPGQRSLVHANGGILSHTAVAVLESV